jgi:glycine cleavage system aminomethyltransferase T/glycine/D-amino acid oxidase-like deaminating enzyme
MTVQSSYDVVVIGGGIIGTSIAYHLATQTPLSVALLERDKLTSGTTWHAAGLVAELRASANLTRLARYTGELFDNLQTDGEDLGFKRIGALTLANNPARVFELQKLAAMARHNDVQCDWLSIAELIERWPHINPDGLLGGVYMPRDGQTNPVDATMALARLAKRHGAEIFEDTPVVRLATEHGQVTGVELAGQMVNARQVVMAAGLWSRNLGLAAGANFPLYPAEHFYAVTESIDLEGDQPILRYPDDGIYIKPDAGRMLVGCFERQAKPIDPDSLPQEFAFGELPFDLDHFLPYYQAATERVPAIEPIGVRTWFNGPESFTPDGRYMLGESPEVSGLFVAAGFNSIGIQSSGGVGQVMAQWLMDKRPPMDLWEVDVRRFQPFQNNADYLVPRTAESLGLLYAMHWPYLQHESARDIRTSPMFEATRAKGACFGEFAGWERPNWYAQAGSTPSYDYTYERPKWFDRCALECQAVRTRAALFDQTSFAKYEIQGPDTQNFLDYLCTANMNVATGKVVYCQWLNEKGGIEADVTVTRINEELYWVVSAAASSVRDLNWMARHRAGFEISITDITENYAVIGIMGPQARQTLQPLTNSDLSHEAFPFATSQEIELAGTAGRAARITYEGALGWELYIPWQAALKVYQLLEHLTHAGYHAMDSLRLEKGYRHWGHDITDEDSPLQAGLSFTVDWNKSKQTLGLAALAQQKTIGVDRRLALFAITNPEVLLTQDEPIWRSGQRVGHVVSSAYSHTFQQSLAFGYIHGELGLTRKSVLAGDYTIEVGANQHQASVSLTALYDPKNLEIHN